ncbi:hypothetical protein B0H16DRAFT_1842052 [Mycena metata]|uniref:Uncharacterized protein n=1 Tax=Mycena metata TaxID=1033252 RepID=A0AAD7IXW6_9AGAR|nr:hypothetical protein B0H16DRAFT_1842052 [Mycena metata]
MGANHKAHERTQRCRPRPRSTVYIPALSASPRGWGVLHAAHARRPHPYGCVRVCGRASRARRPYPAPPALYAYISCAAAATCVRCTHEGRREKNAARKEGDEAARESAASGDDIERGAGEGRSDAENEEEEVGRHAHGTRALQAPAPTRAQRKHTSTRKITRRPLQRACIRPKTASPEKEGPQRSKKREKKATSSSLNKGGRRRTTPARERGRTLRRTHRRATKTEEEGRKNAEDEGASAGAERGKGRVEGGGRGKALTRQKTRKFALEEQKEVKKKNQETRLTLDLQAKSTLLTGRACGRTARGAGASPYSRSRRESASSGERKRNAPSSPDSDYSRGGRTDAGAGAGGARTAGGIGPGGAGRTSLLRRRGVLLLLVLLVLLRQRPGGGGGGGEARRGPTSGVDATLLPRSCEAVDGAGELAGRLWLRLQGRAGRAGAVVLVREHQGAALCAHACPVSKVVRKCWLCLFGKSTALHVKDFSAEHEPNNGLLPPTSGLFVYSTGPHALGLHDPPKLLLPAFISPAMDAISLSAEFELHTLRASLVQVGYRNLNAI